MSAHRLTLVPVAWLARRLKDALGGKKWFAESGQVILNYLHVYFLSYVIITSIFSIEHRCYSRRISSAGSIFSFSYDAITAQWDRDALPFVHIFIRPLAHSHRCLTVLGISVCLPWNVIIISVLEIVWPKRNPTSNIRECHPEHSHRFWYLIWCVHSTYV